MHFGKPSIPQQQDESKTSIGNRDERCDHNTVLAISPFSLDMRTIRQIGPIDWQSKYGIVINMDIPIRKQLTALVGSSNPGKKNFNSTFHNILSTIKRIDFTCLQNENLGPIIVGLVNSYNCIPKEWKDNAPPWRNGLTIQDLARNSYGGYDYPLYMTSFLGALIADLRIFRSLNKQRSALYGNGDKRLHPTTSEALEWAKKITEGGFTGIDSHGRVLAVLKSGLDDSLINPKQRKLINNAILILDGTASGAPLEDVLESVLPSSKGRRSRIVTVGLSEAVVRILNKYGLVGGDVDKVRRADAINAIGEIKAIEIKEITQDRVDKLIKDINNLFGNKAIAKRVSVGGAQRMGNHDITQHLGGSK